MAGVALQTRISWNGPELDKKMLRAVQKELRSIGSDMARELKAKLRARKARKAGASPEGQAPAMVTGALAKAVTRDNRGLRKQRPWVRVGIDFKEAPYAGTLEFGGTIKAKKGNLVIPLNDEARQLQADKRIGDELAAGRLDVIPGKNGRKWIVKRVAGKLAVAKDGVTAKPKAAADEFMFLLAPSVRVAPRPFIRPLVAKWRQPIIDRLSRSIGQTADTFRPGNVNMTDWT